MRGPGWLALALVAAAAFAARLFLVVHGGGLLSVGGYDDGVYYSAADAFVHGRMPYRGFLLLHPPGVLVALAPFAWVGSVTSDPTGMVLGRLGFMAIGAANAVLVALVLRRHSRIASFAGGAFYAIFFPAVYAERSTLLEPLGTLGLLVALLVLSRAPRSRWWVFVAGLALGLTLGVKIWYAAPVLVILAFQRRERPAIWAGMAVGGALIYLPFFVQAPVRMFRYVLTDQLTRSVMRKATPYDRVQSMLGILHDQAVKVLSTGGVEALTLGLALLALAAVVVALRDRAAWLYLALLVTNAAVLFASPSYFGHYATFTATPAALIVGCAVGRVAELSRRTWVRAGVVALALAVVAAVNLPDEMHRIGRSIPGHAVQAAAHRVRGCVTADDPTVLATLNVLSRDLAHGCRVWPDVTGWTYDRDRVVLYGIHLTRRENPRWQRDVTAYLTSGAATIVTRHGTGLSHVSRRYLRSGPVLARAGRFVLRATPTQRSPASTIR